MREGTIGKLHRPVGKLESETVPAFAAPALGDAAPLEHEMRPAAAAEHVAHGETGLAAADDQGFDMLRNHGGGPRVLFPISGYPESDIIWRIAARACSDIFLQDCLPRL